MAEFILTTPTVVPVNSAIPFDDEIVKGCCAIHHRPNSSVITLKGGSCCHPNLYHVDFNALVLGTTDTIQLGVYLDGELLNETLMSVVPASTTGVWSVSTSTEVLAYCDCDNLSVRVVAGTPVTVNRASIIVKKEGTL